MPRYIVLDIGCIECGEVSTVHGPFGTLIFALGERDSARAAHEANWKGEHRFLLWDLENQEEVD